jgi:signal transduction histidine kinase
LKTPLVSIKGFSNLLTEMYKDKLTDDIIKLIEEIKSGVSRLESLIGDILKTAELESENVSFNKSYENLASIIRETVKELEGFIQDRNHEITINLPEELNALVERKNIKEVVGNLLTNAIKYTPPGGQIKVKSQKSEENIKILIQDTGIGLTEEEQSQLFKQFGKIEKYGQGWDIHSEGTGLGLFISKKIIDLHGGSIGVESEGMNKGSTFYFTIPLYSNFEGEVKH